MPTYNISINDELDVIVRQEMKRGKYANRSEFFRELLRKIHVVNDYVVEALDNDDPDYKLLQDRRNNAQFISAEEFKANL